MTKIDEVMHALGNHTWSEALAYGGNLYRVCTVCKRIEYHDREKNSPWWESQYNDESGQKKWRIHGSPPYLQDEAKYRRLSGSLAIPQED